MMKPRTDWTEYMMYFLIVFILGLGMYVITTTAKAHYHVEQERVDVKGWTPRPIPKCDKELWLRIKDGCK